MSLTEKQLAGNQRRSLRAMRDRILAMANEWEGVDQFNVSMLTEVADKITEVAADLVAEDGKAAP